MKFSTIALLSCLSTASAFTPQTFSTRPAAAASTLFRLPSATANEVDTATSAMSESTSKVVNESPTGTVDQVDVSLGFEGVNSGTTTSNSATVPSTESTTSAVAAAAAPMKSSPPPLVTIDKSKIMPGRYAEQETSIAVPFLKRPSGLDGSHAGDYGFDPLGFTKDYDLFTMQESELRHARLAMLAVLGWPISELVAPDFMLQEGGRCPSVLNGFFGQDFFNPLPLLATISIFGGLGYFEYKTALRKVDDKKLGMIHRQDMGEIWNYGVAGDYNWDPLELYNILGDNAFARKGMRDLEISHGRSAMLGITSFAAWEALTGHSIVESSAIFFTPNAVLPALVVGYLAFNQFYELDKDESDTYLRFKLSSEGEARMENLKIGLGANGSSDAGAGFDLDEFSEKATTAVDGVKNAYEKAKEAYMNIVVDSDNYKKE